MRITQVDQLVPGMQIFVAWSVVPYRVSSYYVYTTPFKTTTPDVLWILASDKEGLSNLSILSLCEYKSLRDIGVLPHSYLHKNATFDNYEEAKEYLESLLNVERKMLNEFRMFITMAQLKGQDYVTITELYEMEQKLRKFVEE